MEFRSNISDSTCFNEFKSLFLQNLTVYWAHTVRDKQVAKPVIRHRNSLKIQPPRQLPNLPPTVDSLPTTQPQTAELSESFCQKNQSTEVGLKPAPSETNAAKKNNLKKLLNNEKF